MKTIQKILFALLLLTSFNASAQMSVLLKNGVTVDSSVVLLQVDAAIATKLNITTAASTYLTPTGSAATLTGFPTFNQSTTGSAATFTGALVGDVSGTEGATSVNKINGVTISGLATGIYKNTTGTGAPSIAVAADFPTLNQATTGNAATATLASTVTTNANLTGDLSSVGNATTLATVNSTVGTYSLATVTVNAKGLITAITQGSVGASAKTGEEATGATTATITTVAAPVSATFKIWKNGVRLPAAKFSLTASTVTLTDARVSTDIFQMDYNY